MPDHPAEPGRHLTEATRLRVHPAPDGPTFDGIGAVNGGGATSVLLKDYPEPQRGEILDLLFRPRFGASVSTMLVEIPGDGNATQGSMPSHRHSREDLDHHRGYTPWVMREAVSRNPRLTLDAAAWSSPGWVGGGDFWADGGSDAADYLVSWLEGLRSVHGLELDALGCRNEKGAHPDFAVTLRRALDAARFEGVRIHAFDDWTPDKLDFLERLVERPEYREAIAIAGAHVLWNSDPARPDGTASPAARQLLRELAMPLWNTEDHVYRSGFDCLIGIVECLNESYLLSGATKTVLWYDVAGVYPVQPYAVDPAMIVAHEPWSGHYRVREALWGYAHYGQFTELGWRYVDSASTILDGGGSVVCLASADDDRDYTLIVETQDATAPQRIHIQVDPAMSGADLCVWRSTREGSFERLADLPVEDGTASLTVQPGAVYSYSTTRGQRKGGFDSVPESAPFPFPYADSFDVATDPAAQGRLPHYTADIAGAFELLPRPDGVGTALRQVVPIPPISWAPDWMPYTILGDRDWSDYEVSVDVLLDDGEGAALMARVCHVGTGYGFVPHCYLLRLDADGLLTLAAVHGKERPQELVGDAEQQALIRAATPAHDGGTQVLATTRLPGTHVGRWVTLSLRAHGSHLSAAVNGAPGTLSRPWFANLRITDLDGVTHPCGPRADIAALYPTRVPEGF